MTSRGRELEGRNSGFEGKVVNGDAPLEVGQNGAAILVNGQEKVAPRRKIETVYVCPVRKGQGVRSVSIRSMVSWLTFKLAKEVKEAHTAPDQRQRPCCLLATASMFHRE
jgi:hypothetical protein